MKKIISLLVCLIIAMLVSAGLACAKNTPPEIKYDPAKNYAAFLVVNVAYGKNSLETMQARSIQESYEIGPVAYYEPGTKDFEPLLTKLTAIEQVKLVWIISYITDVNEIKNAMAKLNYKGTYRYVPISEQTGPIKLTP